MQGINPTFESRCIVTHLYTQILSADLHQQNQEITCQWQRAEAWDSQSITHIEWSLAKCANQKSSYEHIHHSEMNTH